MKRILSCFLLYLTTACSQAPAAPAQIDPPFPAPGPVAASPHIFPIETGWFNGNKVEYYNFGTNTSLNPNDPTRVHIEPVWQFVIGQNADGSPIPLPDQHSIFPTTAGDPNYSDLWQPHFVTPSADYVANTLTSAEQLLASDLKIDKQAFFVNCPIVPADSTLTDSDLPLKTAWVKGNETAYYDFGPTAARPGNLYVFVTGFDEANQPLLVPGQHFIFDRTRSESGYSDFWIVQWVQVAAAYSPDSVRAVADIQGTITASTLVVNYPLR